MKKAAIILAIFIVVLVGLFYLIRNSIGDIRPVILPAAQNSQSSEESASPNTNKTSPKTSNLPLQLSNGLAFAVFAENLGKARDLELSPGGTLLISTPNTNQIIALPDNDNDGQADENKVILENLNNPHGLAFYKGKLFVAEEKQVVRYSWNEEQLLAKKEKVLFDLPEGGRHTSRTLAFDSKGNLYVSIGSTCDVCYEKDERIGVMISDSEGTNPRLFAKGLRNAPFITINPKTDELWGTEMGRDFLGDNLPPDEINIIKEGKNYGWPICYGDNVHDVNFDTATYKDNPCEPNEKPTYNIPAHSAPLGLTFIKSDQFPQDWQGDLLVSYHGSWNSTKPVGYKVVRMDVEGNTIRSEEDFFTGFLQGAQTIGRPVDVLFDKEGNLFVSDDKAGRVYMIFQKE